MKKNASLMIIAAMIICVLQVAFFNANAEEISCVNVNCDGSQYSLTLVKSEEQWFINAGDLALLAGISYSTKNGTISFYRTEPFVLLYSSEDIIIHGMTMVPANEASVACGVRFSVYKDELMAERLRTPKDMLYLLSSEVYSYSNIKIYDLLNDADGLGSIVTWFLINSRVYDELSSFSGFMQYLTGEADTTHYEEALKSMLEIDDRAYDICRTLASVDKKIKELNVIISKGEKAIDLEKRIFFSLDSFDQNEVEWKMFVSGLDEYGELGSFRYFLEDYATVSDVWKALNGFAGLTDLLTSLHAEASQLEVINEILSQSETTSLRDASRRLVEKCNDRRIAVLETLRGTEQSILSKAIDEIYEKGYEVAGRSAEEAIIKAVTSVVLDWGLKADKKAEFGLYVPIYSNIQLELATYHYAHTDMAADAHVAELLRNSGIMYLNAALQTFDLLDFDSGIDLDASKEYALQRMAVLLDYNACEYAPDYDNHELVEIAETCSYDEIHANTLKSDGENGVIRGSVIYASDDSPFSGLQIEAYIGDALVGTIVTDADGGFSLELPEYDNYVLRFLVPDGFLPFFRYVTARGGETTDLSTVSLAEGSPDSSGALNGSVTDSSTRTPLSGAVVELRQGWDNPNGQVVGRCLTNQQGCYELEVNAGYYTVAVSTDAYTTAYKNIDISGNSDTKSDDMAPTAIVGEETYRIKLSWGETPNDLDSHLEGYTSNGGLFHIMYNFKGPIYENDEQIAMLDADDTSSYGPEVITIKPVNTKAYYYYVSDYSDRSSKQGQIQTSGAKVEVYKDGQLLQTYYAPAANGNGPYWNVFAIIGSQIVSRNTISDEPDLYYCKELEQTEQITVSAKSLDFDLVKASSISNEPGVLPSQTSNPASASANDATDQNIGSASPQSITTVIDSQNKDLPLDYSSGVLSDVDYLCFSDIAYRKGIQIGQSVQEIMAGKWNSPFSEGYAYTIGEAYANIASWKVVDVLDKSTINGFYGVVFSDGAHAVIAYRGSEGIDQIMNSQDAQLDWLLHDFPMQIFQVCLPGGQIEDAFRLYDEVNADFDRDDISVTGHSLGGLLGDSVAAYSGCKGITFNAVTALDTVYFYYPGNMASAFEGVDKWSFTDHINNADILAGNWVFGEANIIELVRGEWEYRAKRVAEHNCQETMIGSSHGLKTIMQKDSIALYPVSNLHNPQKAIVRNESFLTALNIVPVIPGQELLENHLILGTSSADTLGERFSVGQLVIFGGNGDDRIYTGFADDIIVCGNGHNYADGGLGNDRYIFCKGYGTIEIEDAAGENTLLLIGYSEGDVIRSTVTSSGISISCNGEQFALIHKNDLLSSFSVCTFIDGETKTLFNGLHDGYEYESESKNNTLISPAKRDSDSTKGRDRSKPADEINSVNDMFRYEMGSSVQKVLDGESVYEYSNTLDIVYSEGAIGRENRTFTTLCYEDVSLFGFDLETQYGFLDDKLSLMGIYYYGLMELEKQNELYERAYNALAGICVNESMLSSNDYSLLSALAITIPSNDTWVGKPCKWEDTDGNSVILISQIVEDYADQWKDPNGDRVVLISPNMEDYAEFYVLYVAREFETLLLDITEGSTSGGNG